MNHEQQQPEGRLGEAGGGSRSEHGGSSSKWPCHEGAVEEGDAASVLHDDSVLALSRRRRSIALCPLSNEDSSPLPSR